MTTTAATAPASPPAPVPPRTAASLSHVPDHVHAARTTDGGAVLLNSRSGQWFAMNSVAAQLWHDWCHTDEFGDTTATGHTDTPAVAGSSQAEAELLFTALLARGLIVRRRTATPGRRSQRRAKPIPPMSTSLPAPALALRGIRVAGPLALLVTLVVVKLPFRFPVGLLRALRRHWCAGPASEAQARIALDAVRAAAWLYPGRIACLELSFATVLTMALLRRRVDWCVGFADIPLRLHAWVAANGCSMDDDPASAGLLLHHVLSV